MDDSNCCCQCHNIFDLFEAHSKRMNLNRYSTAKENNKYIELELYLLNGVITISVLFCFWTYSVTKYFIKYVTKFMIRGYSIFCVCVFKVTIWNQHQCLKGYVTTNQIDLFFWDMWYITLHIEVMVYNYILRSIVLSIINELNALHALYTLTYVTPIDNRFQKIVWLMKFVI